MKEMKVIRMPIKNANKSTCGEKGPEENNYVGGTELGIFRIRGRFRFFYYEGESAADDCKSREEGYPESAKKTLSQVGGLLKKR